MAERREIAVVRRAGVAEDLREVEGEVGQERGVTLRAVVFGICVAVGVSLLANTVVYVLHGSYMTISMMPMVNLMLFLLSVLACAALARLFGRRFVFSQAEWITIFCMGFSSAICPTYRTSGYLLSILASPYYFATPENRWAEYIHPYLPGWLIPSNENGAITQFFEGLPKGALIPWEVWAVPLLWSFLLVAAFVFACFCVSVILHRQWAEHEKLVYPALTPILEMTARAGTGRRALPEFMKGKAFWAGLALTSFVFCWNMIGWFYPHFPQFPTGGGWSGSFHYLLPRNYPPFFIFPSTVVICFSYFASLEVLFSIWFFDLLYVFEAGLLNRFGIVATSSSYVGAGPYAVTSYKWQTAGAFIALVLWWLWISRGHLRNVLNKAIRPSVDDSREMLSYRTAVVGLIVCSLYIAAWLGQVGIEAKMVVLLVPTAFLVFVGLAKMMADSGLVYLEASALCWDYSLFALGGASEMKPSTHAASGLLAFTLNHPWSSVMPMMSHACRLGDFVWKDKRRLFWSIWWAFIVGVTVSTVFIIWLAYREGAHSFQNWSILREGVWQYGLSINAMSNPRPILTVEYWLFLGGVVSMLFLTFMRYRFAWWPFHPVGFAFSGTIFTRLESFTILIAWLLKFLMLKIGGVSFYRRSRPFFVGMLVGYILAVVAGLVVDAVWFPGQGHRVHQWY